MHRPTHFIIIVSCLSQRSRATCWRCPPRPSSSTIRSSYPKSIWPERRATAGVSHSLIDLTIPSPVRAYVSIHDSVQALFVDWNAISVSVRRGTVRVGFMRVIHLTYIRTDWSVDQRQNRLCWLADGLAGQPLTCRVLRKRLSEGHSNNNLFRTIMFVLTTHIDLMTMTL